MNVTITFDSVRVVDTIKDNFTVKVLMLKGEKGDTGTLDDNSVTYSKLAVDVREKVQNAPDSPDADGLYVVQSSNGTNTYVALPIYNGGVS